MIMRRMLFLCFLAIWMLGCGAGNSEDPLAGTKWRLVLLAGQDPIPGSTITLEFKDGMLSGSAGCNSYAGGYKVEGDQLTTDAIAMTEMACVQDGVMQQEAKFAEAFTNVKTYKLGGEVLELIDSSGGILLRFTKDR